MASGHGVDKPNKANDPKRKVGRDSLGGTPEPVEDAMSNDEWLKHMMGKYGHGGL